MAYSLWQSLTRRLHRSPAAQPPQPLATEEAILTPEPPTPAAQPPASVASAPKKEAANQQKQQRSAQREQLSQLVQESMLRAGIVGTAYKFKALSLDTHGEQFLVLFDLEGQGIDTQHSHLNRIGENLKILVQARAPSLHVKQVYWHVNNPSEKPATPRPKRHLDFLPTQPMGD